MRRTSLSVVVLLVLAACGAGDSADSDVGGGTVTVFAASSLADAFEEIAAAFEAEHPGVDVVLNLASSSALREQILAGAPADVFASANAANVDQLVEAGVTVGEPTALATNRLQIAVPADNPGGVTALDDLARSDLLVGLCAEQVPCGQFAREALAAAGVEPSVDTEEPDARSLLTKVEEGELDVGIVYRTDVLAAGDAVRGIDLPADADVVATYPIVTLTDDEPAAAFVAFVLGDEGQAILAAHGFITNRGNS